MLKLDQFSENLFFQCDRCRFVGELFIEIVEEEGHYHCWSCLSEIHRAGKNLQKQRRNMPFTDRNDQGEQWFECVECGAKEKMNSIFTDESGSHHCLSCWCERNQGREKKSRLVVIEL